MNFDFGYRREEATREMLSRAGITVFGKPIGDSEKDKACRV